MNTRIRIAARQAGLSMIELMKAMLLLSVLAL